MCSFIWLLRGKVFELYSLNRLFTYFFLFCVVGLWVLRPLTGLLYQPRMIGDGDCGENGGMKIGRGNRSTRRKPTQAPLWPPLIPHDYTRIWTRAAAVGSQQKNIVSIAIAQKYLACCLPIRCCGNLFTNSLTSNEHLLGLRYSGFQALCHNIVTDLTKLLPGSVSMFKRATIEKCRRY
jgi:hypothetical protein